MGINQVQKQQVVELMQSGQSWSAALEQVGVKASEATAYRWVRCWQERGEAGLQEGRHGHVSKMTPEVETWLKEYCEQTPDTPSRELKTLIEAQFQIKVSRGHLNRVRAAWGVSRPKKSFVE
jgi:transposase